MKKLALSIFAGALFMIPVPVMANPVQLEGEVIKATPVQVTSAIEAKPVLKLRRKRRKVRKFVRKQIVRRLVICRLSKKIRRERRKFVRRQLVRRVVRHKLRKSIWKRPFRPQIIKRFIKCRVSKKIRRERRRFVVKQLVRRGLRRLVTFKLRKTRRQFFRSLKR